MTDQTWGIIVTKEMVVDFAERVAKVFNESRSSHTFFILQEAYPENADTWEWSDYQNLIDGILKGKGE